MIYQNQDENTLLLWVHTTFDYLDRKMDKHDFLRSVLRAEPETTITREVERNVCLTYTFFCVQVSSMRFFWYPTIRTTTSYGEQGRTAALN